jgi:hypothetical protein
MDELEAVRIRKIGVLSVANLLGIINFFMGFLIGLIIVIFSYFLTIPMLNLGYYLIIIVPVINGILGFIIGAIGALLYNLVAKITKGIILYS